MFSTLSKIFSVKSNSRSKNEGSIVDAAISDQTLASCQRPVGIDKEWYGPSETNRVFDLQDQGANYSQPGTLNTINQSLTRENAIYVDSGRPVNSLFGSSVVEKVCTKQDQPMGKVAFGEGFGSQPLLRVNEHAFCNLHPLDKLTRLGPASKVLRLRGGGPKRIFQSDSHKSVHTGVHQNRDSPPLPFGGGLGLDNEENAETGSTGENEEINPRSPTNVEQVAAT